MTTMLLDANVLIALTVAEHEHHSRANAWAAGLDMFAIDPVVEGALVRFLLRVGESAKTAAAVLARVREHPRCLFWPDSLSYLDVDIAQLHGHRQVTDAYLVILARANSAQLATLDVALADLHPADTVLLPQV